MSIVERIIREVPQDLHASGSLSPTVLEAIVELHCDAGARVSAETGCGLTTLILSHLSESHTSFTVAIGDSLPKTQNHPLFRRETTHFVIGPSQLTLPRWQFTRPLDFAIIDGPHAYPFPDIEYFYFYPNIRPGGILVVDDIHIPMITKMYRFLREDEMWEHSRDVGTTAFFRRSTAPLFDPYGDNWPQQRHQRRFFSYPTALDPLFGAGWRAREFGADAPESYVESAISSADTERPTLAHPPETEANLAQLREALRAAEGEIAQLRQGSSSLEASYAKAESELAVSRAAEAAARAEAKALRDQIAALHASKSWRVTRPFRSIRNRIKN